MEVQSNNNSESIPTVNVTDGREALPKFWIAAYTRPRSEKKVVSEIEKLGIETYLPTQIVLRQWSDRKKKVEIATIPMVSFFYVDVNEIAIIIKHPLIIRLISRPGEKEYAKIPDMQIDNLKFILGQSDIPVSFIPNIKVDDNVRIRRGKLMGLTGKIVQCEDGATDIIVGLDFLGGCRLRIDRIDIELL